MFNGGSNTVCKHTNLQCGTHCSVMQVGCDKDNVYVEIWLINYAIDAMVGVSTNTLCAASIYAAILTAAYITRLFVSYQGKQSVTIIRLTCLGGPSNCTAAFYYVICSRLHQLTKHLI